jgi:hypothetical protein
MLAGRKCHAMLLLLLLLLLLLDFAAVVGLWKRCCVNGDGARSTEYMLVSRLLSLQYSVGDMHPLPGLSLSLQSSSLPRLLLLNAFSFSRYIEDRGIAMSPATTASLFFEAIPQSASVTTIVGFATSSSPLIPRRIASLVLPQLESRWPFWGWYMTPEHLPAMPIRTRLPG